MKYLVTMELIGSLSDSPQGVLQHLEETVIPSHETLVKLEADERILAGGLPVGQRRTVLVVEVASNAEVSQLLARLPLWGSHKVEVIPLESFEERQALHWQLAERLKAVIQSHINRSSKEDEE